jgi:hypothetical protein
MATTASRKTSLRVTSKKTAPVAAASSNKEAAPSLKTAVNEPNEHKVNTSAPLGNTDITALLPSRLAIYEEEVAYLRPYTMKELMRIGTVNLAQSIRPVIEAIGACTNLDISTLTRIDMWTMAYWLRLNSL